MTDNAGTGPPPGWYADPADPRMVRWWDGTTWTEHTSMIPARRPDPRFALGEERSIAKWARHATIAYAFLTVIAGALTFRMFTGLRDFFQEVMTNPNALPNSGEPPAIFTEPMFGMSPGAIALLQLVNLTQLGLLVVLLIWLYRAATAAAQLGIPARRGPGWAVGSWFIPVDNLWWPYQALCDLLPPDHATRRRMLPLWLLWVVGSLVTVVGLMTWMFGPDFGIFIGALGYLMSASALLAGRAFVDAVLTSHEALGGASA